MHRLTAVVASVAALKLAAGAASTVDVTLQEFGIAPSAASAPAGHVAFDVVNQGPKETLEFVVIKTDLAPDALPTKADGSVNEETDGLQAVDEIEASRSAIRRH